MTVAEAEKALGTKLVRDNAGDPDYDACDYVSRIDGKEPGIGYMVRKGTISRIELVSGDNLAPTLRTAEGIGIGSSEQSVRRAYGTRLTIEPRPYQGKPDHELTVETPDHKRAFVFETTQGRVDEVRTGDLPAVKYWEGCD